MIETQPNHTDTGVYFSQILPLFWSLQIHGASYQSDGKQEDLEEVQSTIKEPDAFKQKPAVNCLR